jgi:16S rRNA G527 N7-methylase RsmG
LSKKEATFVQEIKERLAKKMEIVDSRLEKFDETMIKFDRRVKVRKIMSNS